MSRLAAVAALLLVAAAPGLSDPQVEAALRALKGDSSLKVRTQAAIVLGQRSAQEGVRALRDAVAGDRAVAVRIAAVAALAKIGDRSARSTLRLAAQADPDESVRRAAARALSDLGPVALAIEEPSGPVSARGPLREALARNLAGRGYAVTGDGELRLRPTVNVDVSASGTKTVIAVRTSVALVDGDGRVDLVESSARASLTGAVPENRLAAYAAKAIDAAARTLCEDLAVKLGER